MEDDSSPERQVDVDIIEFFDNMALNQCLLDAIHHNGIMKPSIIQQRAIVPMIKGGDLIVESSPLTGKTVALAVAILQRMDFKHRNMLQALVLLPTRELAQQTHGVMTQFAQFMTDDTSGICLFVGGSDVCDNIQAISAGCVIAVGTPGRVVDLLERGSLQTKNMKMFVLDEADELLSEGLKVQVTTVFMEMPRNVQIALFSATISNEALESVQIFMHHPTRILLKMKSLTLSNVRQYFIAVEDDKKLDTLMGLHESISIEKSVIFANTRQRVSYIAKKLNENGYMASSIHSDMSRGEREHAMEEFRASESHVLITTDLTARYIDVQHVSIVINFNLPKNPENYIHRIGCINRIGHSEHGRRGIVINFVPQHDTQILQNIESHYSTSICEFPEDFDFLELSTSNRES